MSFDSIINCVEIINKKINSFVWGYPAIVLIIFTGVVITFGTGFFQVRGVKHWLGKTAGSMFGGALHGKHSPDSGKHISQLQAACTVLAATIGTGNIAGVATAISIGGPGAVLWMWVSAFFGMMTSYAENVLGVVYRRKNLNGEWCGGPMYYISEGIRHKKTGKMLSVLFAVFCVFSSFGMGNMTQVNSISSALNSDFGVGKAIAGAVVAVLAGIVIVGGVKRLGKVTERLVPVMSFLYIGVCMVILVVNYKRIPYVFGSIVSGAFSLRPVVGAGSGLVIKRAFSYGIRRGIFSNEAGLGSAVIINSASDNTSPVQQGMWGMFEVFFDTIIVCSITAFVLLSSECNAVPFEQALKNVSGKTEYVAVCDVESYCNNNGVPLMDITPKPVIKLVPPCNKPMHQYEVYPENGEPFDIFLKPSQSDVPEDYIHTNIMSLRGVCLNPETGKTESKGNINAVILEKVEGVQLVTYAFSQIFGTWAGKILALAVVFFAFSTLIAWSYCGVKSWEYLFGSEHTVIYKLLFISFIIPGAILSPDFVWSVSDTFNGLMVIPNLLGVLALSGKVFKITAKHFRQDK